LRSRVRAATVVAVAVTALIAVPSSAPTVERTGPGTVVVSGGTLVDGTGREPLAGATIVVRDGRVAEVTAGGVTPLRPDDIDARGKWIVPGLIDMHVHYQPGWMDALFIRHSVTTVRDVGGGLDTILGLREESRTPGIARPRIFACGPLIDGPWPRHGTGISVSVQTPAEASAAARRLGCLKPFLARLQRAGGQVVAGSDTSNPSVVPGASLHRELELLVEAGLSPREALAAATRTAAAFLGQAQTLGTLEVGKTADLVVRGADPLASIAAIREVEVVIRDGRVVWRR
jgi:imidazolonepropionase-like amidohydrolase